MILRLSNSVWLLLLGIGAAVAAAQSARLVSAPVPQNATIMGTVLDINGGIVPGAKVVLSGSAPSEQQSVIADANGFFQFRNLKADVPYRVTISSPQFAVWTSQEIRLRPGQFFVLSGISLHISTVQVTVTALTPEQIATQQVEVAEQQRVFGVIPNFYVTYDPHPAPLTAKLKFQLAYRALIDPVTMAGFVINAGAYQAADYPHYAGGFKGYGQRLGATFVGGYTKIMIGDAILPSVLHQDPRYFYQGTGTTRSRLMHAIGSPFVTRGDNGRREINFSDIGGDLASGAIAESYYPEDERGAGLVVRSALIGAGGRMANGILQEFVLPKIKSRTKEEDR